MLGKWWRLLRNNFTLNPTGMFFLLRHALTLWLLNIETRRQFAEAYGDFHRGRDLRDYRLMNPGSEGGAIIGDVVYLASTVDTGDGQVLLAGDRNEVKAIWGRHFDPAKIVTCGIHHMDHHWNFEDPLPGPLAALRFRLIVSHAMLEHLVDPYKHMRDLASMLESGGVLVAHSVLPGFFYHRVPIDCMRFYPDWFETVASRLDLEVVEKQISVFHLTYKLRKP